MCVSGKCSALASFGWRMWSGKSVIIIDADGFEADGELFYSFSNFNLKTISSFWNDRLYGGVDVCCGIVAKSISE